MSFFPKSADAKKVVSNQKIKIKIEVQYDKNESISLFSDYLMELSDTCTSFFFLFNYEINIAELNKKNVNFFNLLN